MIKKKKIKSFLLNKKKQKLYKLISKIINYIFFLINLKLKLIIILY